MNSVFALNITALDPFIDYIRSWPIGKLLLRMAEIPGIARLRYSTSHPRDVESSLIEAHRDLSDEQSSMLNAKLILLLANHIGDLDVIREALLNRIVHRVLELSALRSGERMHSHHCALMPASRITLPHFSISDLIFAAKPSGVLVSTSAPLLKNFSLMSAALSARTISWFNRVTIGAGVFAGARMPT